MLKMNWFCRATVGMALLVAGCFCGAGPGQTEASLYLTDTTSGAAIKSPAFTENDRTISASCQEHDKTDPTLCTSEVLVLSSGTHRITISAPGYVSQTVTVDTSASDSAHLAVEMTPAR